MLLRCHLRREEELIYVTEYHQQVEAQIGEAGRMEGHLLVRGLLRLLSVVVLLNLR